MVYSVLGLFRLKIGFLLLSLLADHGSSSNYYINSRCLPTPSYIPGNQFDVSLRNLFTKLKNAASSALFSNATEGLGSETVYGLVQCRGDVDREACYACVHTSTEEVMDTYCPKAMDAIIWYEKCQLRYSNTNFFGQFKVNPEDSGNRSTNHKAEDSKALYQKLESLLKNNLTSEATKPSGPKFQKGEIPYTNLQSLYGLVQCTEDTSLADCGECLRSITSQIPTTCNGAEGCEIVTANCRLRYDTILFYDVTATSIPSPPPPPSNGASNTKSGPGDVVNGKVIVTSVLIAVLIITCAVCGFCWWKSEFCCFWRKKFSGLQRMEEEDAALQGW